MAEPNVDVPLEVAKGLVNLAVALMVTGVLSYILSERTRKQGELAESKRRTQAEQTETDRRKKAEQAESERVLVGALQDLKAAHEKVQIVQFRLNAERTPMKLSEQMEVLVETRAALQRLRHERLIKDDIGAYGQIKRMTNYIRAIAEEYARNLPTITQLSTAFNRDMQQYLRGEADSPPSEPSLNSTDFERMDAFLSDEQFDNGEFRDGYNKARRWIEEKLSGLRQ